MGNSTLDDALTFCAGEESVKDDDLVALTIIYHTVTLLLVLGGAILGRAAFAHVRMRFFPHPKGVGLVFYATGWCLIVGLQSVARGYMLPVICGDAFTATVILFLADTTLSYAWCYALLWLDSAIGFTIAAVLQLGVNVTLLILSLGSEKSIMPGAGADTAVATLIASVAFLFFALLVHIDFATGPTVAPGAYANEQI
jgi:hypothetical protein